MPKAPSRTPARPLPPLGYECTSLLWITRSFPLPPLFLIPRWTPLRSAPTGQSPALTTVRPAAGPEPAGGDDKAGGASDDEDTLEIMEIETAAAAFVLGRGGSTKRKVERVSECRMDLDERRGTIEIRGKKANRQRARDYVNF
eukprot:COSAG01_NODE_14327_length_1467_cov_27.765351_2_plen_142_part_01